MMWVFGIVIGVFVIGTSSLLYLVKMYLDWLIGYYSFHASIHHVIKEMQRFRQQLRLKEFETLNLHIVSKYPMFDKEPWWEICMADFYDPEIVNTKTLNVVFIVESKEPFEPLLTSSKTILSKDRIVTHTMKQMYYHMYYSSSEYTEPDAVLVYNTSIMLENEQDALHCEISFRNMIAKESSVLALFDTTKERLKQGVKAVESAQSGLFVWDYRKTPWSMLHFTSIQRYES